MNQLAAPRRLSPINARRYNIEKHTGTGWVLVAYAVGTNEADNLIRRKVQFEGGRYRAMEISAK